MDHEILKSVHKIYESDKSGTIFAADEVFHTIVGVSASEVEGVMGLADLNTGELLTKINAKTLSKCLRFDFANNQITVLVGIIVLSGSNLLSVSKAVQTKVRAAVKDLIGSDLTRVNVQISDVRSK